MTIIGFMAGFAFGYSVADLAVNIYEYIHSKSNQSLMKTEIRHDS
ncbi:hypothetical protein [Synechococcus phage DSL-LC03]|nr:hypothetical protein [Synechococcus phage DSL-LC03]